MNPESKRLKVAEIMLDERNPRFPEVTNQKETINAMADEQKEKLFNLAKDIHKRGLDPTKRLLVFREEGKLVAGDGNRRLTAIKILETPSLLTADPSLRKKFEKLRKEKYVAVEEIECIILNSRDAARHWIQINHSGEQEGRGQVPWNSTQSDRFKGKLSSGLAAMEALYREGLIEEREKKEVEKTTFDRVLDFQVGKKALSIEKDGDIYHFRDLKRLHELFQAMKGMKVESVYRAKKAEEFLTNLFGDTTPGLLDPQGSVQVQSNLRIGDELGETEEAEKVEDKAKSRTRRSNRPRHTPFGGMLNLKTSEANNLYRDLENLYHYYTRNKGILSTGFIVLFRMGLRLLAETAAKEEGQKVNEYLSYWFEAAKETLSSDDKTTLSNQNVTKGTAIQLFQSGAHDYTNARNEEQAIAMSIILGAILTLSHKKE